MKKIINIFLILLFSVISLNVLYAPSDYRNRYEVNAPNISEKELKEYYIKNNIRPANAPNGSEAKLYQSDVSSHLSKRFVGYNNWKKTSTSFSVSNVYGENPISANEWDDITQKAKTNAGIKYKYIGCGPLSLVTQFDFLARNAGYSSIARDANDDKEQLILQTQIFKNTKAIPAESFVGDFFGVDPDSGTFTFPSEVISSSRNLLIQKHLGFNTTKETIDNEGNIEKTTYYDSRSQIYVYGDTIPSTALFSRKIDNLKDSINKGMPVIWWTCGGAGQFSNHYMNIFGYEYWSGTDSSGNTKMHLMFKLRYNWNDSEDIYMDSDVLNAVNGGFIYFEETRDKSLIRPSDYNYECQYPSEEIPAIVYPSKGYLCPVYTKRKRAGYVNHFDSSNTHVDKQLLVLSVKKENAGVAYLEYEFPRLVQEVYFDVRWWSGLEGISYVNSKALLQYTDGRGEWNTALDLLRDIPSPGLSNLEDYPTEVFFTFPVPTYKFRIYMETTVATGSRNKGRIVLGNLNVYFDHHLHHSYNFRYELNNSFSHKSYCECGDYIFEPHVESDISTLSTIKERRCRYCGYTMGTSILI